jgi:hypothetical protein
VNCKKWILKMKEFVPLKIEVTVRCVKDNTSVYSCDVVYSSEGNVLVQSEVDDHTKAIASDALYMTSTLLRNQIKTELSDKEAVDVRKSKPW